MGRALPLATEGGEYGTHAPRYMEARRRLERSSDLVCARCTRVAAAAHHRPHELALSGGDARHRPAALACVRLSCRRRETSFENRPKCLLEAMPAPELVLPAMAPRLSRGVRGDHPGRNRAARWPGGLGIAVLELQREEPGEGRPDPAGLSGADATGRHTEPAAGRATLRRGRARQCSAHAAGCPAQRAA